MLYEWLSRVVVKSVGIKGRYTGIYTLVGSTIPGWDLGHIKVPF